MAKTFATTKEGNVVKLGPNAAAAAAAKAARGTPGGNTIIGPTDPRIAQQRTANLDARAAGAENKSPAVVPTPANVSQGNQAAPSPDEALQTPPEAPQAPVSPDTTGQVSYEQAQKNLASGGLTGGALSAAQGSLSNRYKQGLAAANASGVAPPADAGAARTGVQSYLPAESPNSSVVDDIFSSDPVIGTLMASINDLLSPKNQTTSLMQDYKKLRKDSGLDDINEELIDAETVLDGTEDDIRNEIQTAGGMGTESQVQAMTLARNKGLLKRYNQLVQMKTDATNNLNTMMQLSAQDKQMAQERINTAITANFNMANFRQTALQNTRQQQQFMIQTMGADGYYATVANDPRQLAMAEKILGIAPGGLQAVAAQAATERAHKTYIEDQQLAIQQGQLAISRANFGLEQAKFAYEKSQPKPQTQAQLQVQGYADRLGQSDPIISKLGSQFAAPGNMLTNLLPNIFKGAEKQQFEQARRNFINATLRRESGASIAPDEFKNAKQQYFPEPGDTVEVLAQKAANRNTVVNSFYREAGADRPVSAGQVVVKDGQQFRVNADGSYTAI